MKKLLETKKITLASLKSFAKRNADNLYTYEKSSFDGMTDCVQETNRGWFKTKITDDTYFYRTGIQGIYTVGNSRDLFELYEDDEYFGIEVYNCCGTSILAVKK